MLRFVWNALRTGDKVLVHDSGSAELALTSGVVAVVDTHKGASGVGIRVTASGGERVMLWPSYLAVHLDPCDPTEPCWWCQALAEQAEQRSDTLAEGVAVEADGHSDGSGRLVPVQGAVL